MLVFRFLRGWGITFPMLLCKNLWGMCGRGHDLHFFVFFNELNKGKRHFINPKKITEDSIMVDTNFIFLWIYWKSSATFLKKLF